MASEITPDFLRARYLDWCSAKVAERFLGLTPDEIWHRSVVLRESLPQGEGVAVGDQAFPEGSAFFLARALAAQLAAELDLPALDVWSERYAADPEPFERDIVMYGRSLDSSEESSSPR